MMLLKQSTAVTLKFGPFMDEDDGKTAETALTITQPDVRLSKNGGNIAQKSAAGTASHDELGYYDVSLSTTDTNTLGILMVAVHESGALPVFQYFQVVPANVYDSLVLGSDDLNIALSAQGKLDVNAEVDIALNTVIPASPTAGSMNDAIKNLEDREVRRNTAQSATASTLRLDTGASSVQGLYAGLQVAIVSGAAVGQVRQITNYNGSTKNISINPD